MKILIQLLLFVTMTIASTTIELNTVSDDKVVELINQHITKKFTEKLIKLEEAEIQEEKINDDYIKKEEEFYEKSDEIDESMEKKEEKIEKIDLLKAKQELETAKNNEENNNNNIKGVSPK